MGVVRTGAAPTDFAGVQPRPQRAAREAQAVEPVRIVFVEPRGEHVALPGGGRDLVALELRDDRGEAFDAFGLRLARDALPFEQEAHEVRARHRLDLGAQRLDGVAMDARQQAAFAPFERGVALLHGFGRARLFGEAAAQHEAFALELDERDVDFGEAQSRATRPGRAR